VWRLIKVEAEENPRAFAAPAPGYDLQTIDLLLEVDPLRTRLLNEHTQERLLLGCKVPAVG
jgi:hypothetical protein